MVDRAGQRHRPAIVAAGGGGATRLRRSMPTPGELCKDCRSAGFCTASCISSALCACAAAIAKVPLSRRFRTNDVLRPAKWDKMCNWGCVVGGSGISSRQRAGVEGLLPLLHLGSVINFGALPSGPLSWHVRPYARREEPPYGAGALPRGTGRGGGTRDARGPEAVRRRVAPGGVRALQPPRAG